MLRKALQNYMQEKKNLKKNLEGVGDTFSKRCLTNGLAAPHSPVGLNLMSSLFLFLFFYSSHFEICNLYVVYTILIRYHRKPAFKQLKKYKNTNNN